MTKNIYINDIAFNQIINNNKNIEGRLLRGLFKNLKEKEIIQFVCNKTKKKCKVLINSIVIYNSIHCFLENENINCIIHKCKGLDHALNIYKKHYPKILDNKFKIIAIHFTKI